MFIATCLLQLRPGGIFTIVHNITLCIILMDCHLIIALHTHACHWRCSVSVYKHINIFRTRTSTVRGQRTFSFTIGKQKMIILVLWIIDSLRVRLLFLLLFSPKLSLITISISPCIDLLLSRLVHSASFNGRNPLSTHNHRIALTYLSLSILINKFIHTLSKLLFNRLLIRVINRYGVRFIILLNSMS